MLFYYNSINNLRYHFLTFIRIYHEYIFILINSVIVMLLKDLENVKYLFKNKQLYLKNVWT